MTNSPLDLFEPGNLTDQERARHENLAGLIAAGIDPYPARVTRTHTIAAVRELHESGAGDEEVTVTGRLTRNRDMGKLSFADIEDGSGKSQVLGRRDSLPEGFYTNLWKKLIDLGDFIGVTPPPPEDASSLAPAPGGG